MLPVRQKRQAEEGPGAEGEGMREVVRAVEEHIQDIKVDLMRGVKTAQDKTPWVVAVVEEGEEKDEEGVGTVAERTIMLKRLRSQTSRIQRPLNHHHNPEEMASLVVA